VTAELLVQWLLAIELALLNFTLGYGLHRIAKAIHESKGASGG
jgi:hypothetical protein